jgi:hypothetical protein
MSSPIISSQIYKSLKKTLDRINTDDLKKKQKLDKVFEISSMADQWVDDVEYAGTTLVQPKTEGGAIAVGTMIEGGTKRYSARTYGLAVLLAEESLEDCKYKEVLQIGKRLNKSAFKTQDVDAANIINRSTTSTATGGFDGVCLASASHTLPSGGTWSNIATSYGVYQTPSIPALNTAYVATQKYPDPNGLQEGVDLKALVCPVAQEMAWATILETPQVTGNNNNDINFVRRFGLELVPWKWLDLSSTTQWGLVTDAENGLMWKNRRPIRQRTWVDNNTESMWYSVTYRAAWGWSNPRCWYQGNT